MPAKEDTDYSPAGTWYGGSDLAKYQYTFIPGDSGRFFLTAQAAYSPNLIGVALLNTFTGELVKKTANNYELRLMALTRKDPGDPEDMPGIVAGKADVQIDGDKMTLSYNWAGFYGWEQIPFVDAPHTWHPALSEGPVIETLSRMQMGTELPSP